MTDDVDIWVQDPIGDTVSFLRKDAVELIAGGR